MLGRNCVSLGNGLFAQVQLYNNVKEDEMYHVKMHKDLKVQIDGDTVTWFLPVKVFDDGRNHTNFKIKLFSENNCLIKLKKNMIYNDDDVDLIIYSGSDTLYSWGNEGGDFCIINPKSKISALLEEQVYGDVSSLIITTYKERRRSHSYSQRDETDGATTTRRGLGGRTQADGSSAHFATFGKSSQKFKRANFDEDEGTAIQTIFNFVVIEN